MANKTYWFSAIVAFVAMGVVAVGASMVAQDQLASIMAISRGEAMLMGWQMAGYFLITAVFVYIYTKSRQEGCWQEGARYGAIFGLIMCGVSMLNYSIFPIEIAAMVADIIINIIVLPWAGLLQL